MSEILSDEVLVSWRDCNCGWATKYCDEEHARYALVPRDGLDRLAFGAPDLRTEGES